MLVSVLGTGGCHLLEQNCSFEECKEESYKNGLCKYHLTLQERKFVYELLEDGSGYQIIELLDKSSNNVVILEEFNGLPVTSIGEWAFYNCSSLRSIEIPSSASSIGDDAFPDGCKVIRVDK